MMKWLKSLYYDEVECDEDLIGKETPRKYIFRKDVLIKDIIMGTVVGIFILWLILGA